MPLTIVSWNCQGAFRTKAAALLADMPDLAIIQECEPLERLAGTPALGPFQTVAWFGDSGKKGMLVLSPHALSWTLDPAYDPTIQLCVPLRLRGGFALNLLAVWTKHHRQQAQSYVGQLYRAVAMSPSCGRRRRWWLATGTAISAGMPSGQGGTIRPS